MITYRNLAMGQEAPQTTPNELVESLAQLTGYRHYDIHLLLIGINPVLVERNDEIYLDKRALTAVSEALDCLDL